MHPAARYLKGLFKAGLGAEQALQTAKKNLILRKDLTIDEFRKFYTPELLEVPDTEHSLLYESDNKYRLEVERAFQRNLTLKTATSVMIMLKYSPSTIASSLRTSGYEGIEERTVAMFRDVFFDVELVSSGEEALKTLSTVEYQEYNELLQYAFFKPDLHFVTKLGILPPVSAEQLVKAITSLAFARLLEEIRSKNSSLSTTELLRMAFGAQELSARMKAMQSDSFYDKVATLLKQISIQTDNSKDVAFHDLQNRGDG